MVLVSVRIYIVLSRSPLMSSNVSLLVYSYISFRLGTLVGGVRGARPPQLRYSKVSPLIAGTP